MAHFVSPIGPPFQWTTTTPPLVDAHFRKCSSPDVESSGFLTIDPNGSYFKDTCLFLPCVQQGGDCQTGGILGTKHEDFQDGVLSSGVTIGRLGEDCIQ